MKCRMGACNLISAVFISRVSVSISTTLRWRRIQQADMQRISSVSSVIVHLNFDYPLYSPVCDESILVILLRTCFMDRLHLEHAPGFKSWHQSNTIAFKSSWHQSNTIAFKSTTTASHESNPFICFPPLLWFRLSTYILYIDDTVYWLLSTGYWVLVKRKGLGSVDRVFEMFKSRRMPRVASHQSHMDNSNVHASGVPVYCEIVLDRLDVSGHRWDYGKDQLEDIRASERDARDLFSLAIKPSLYWSRTGKELVSVSGILISVVCSWAIVVICKWNPPFCNSFMCCYM